MPIWRFRNIVIDLLNVAYVIVKEFVNIRILNGFPLDPIVILGIPMMPKGTHLHAFQCLPQLAYLMLHHLPKLLIFDFPISLWSLNVSLVVESWNSISLINNVVIVYRSCCCSINWPSNLNNASLDTPWIWLSKEPHPYKRHCWRRSSLL